VELQIRDFYLGGDGLEAYYLEDPHPAMAVDPDVGSTRRRMWELVAHGLNSGIAESDKIRRIRQSKHRHDRAGIFFFEAREPKHADPLAVKVLVEVLPETEPEWILDVLEVRRLSDNQRVVAAWCGLPVEVALAVMHLSFMGRL
jgi:hypothetical protein